MDKIAFALSGHMMDTTSFGRLRELFRAHPVWIVPTLASLRALGMAGTPEYGEKLAAPEIAFVDSATLGWWKSLARGRGRADAPGPFYAYQIAILKTLKQLGTSMVLGTDCGNPLMVCGFAVYDELAALVRDAGFANYDALQLATVNVGKFLNEPEHGVIRTGAAAHLVLLDGNPLTDLTVLRRPVGVFTNGKWLDRDQLDALLQGAKAL
jgi:hypothetical protein